MKARIQILIGAMLIALLVTTVVAIAPYAATAKAALGNQGIPVRCVPSQPGQGINPGQSIFFRCTAADGTPFTDDGQRVPAGYYLLVTDIIATPDAGTDAAGENQFALYDGYGDNNRAYGIELRNSTAATFSTHQTVPYLILPEEHRIEGVNAGNSDHSVQVYVSGLLVTNVNYIPFVAN